MKLGKVIGQVVSTRKEDNITGLKLSVVRYLDERLQETKKTAVYIDSVKTSPGDIVLLCTSSSARMTKVTQKACTDSAIVAIVDSISTGKQNWYKREKGKDPSKG